MFFDTFIFNSIKYCDDTVLNLNIAKGLCLVDTFHERYREEGEEYIHIHLFNSMSCLVVIDSYYIISQL